MSEQHNLPNFISRFRPGRASGGLPPENQFLPTVSRVLGNSEIPSPGKIGLLTVLMVQDSGNLDRQPFPIGLEREMNGPRNSRKARKIRGLSDFLSPIVRMRSRHSANFCSSVHSGYSAGPHFRRKYPDFTRMARDLGPESPPSSANGAPHTSPGQRPGSRYCPEKHALKGRRIPRCPRSPFRAPDDFWGWFPGRCPGLVCDRAFSPVSRGFSPSLPLIPRHSDFTPFCLFQIRPANSRLSNGPTGHSSSSARSPSSRTGNLPPIRGTPGLTGPVGGQTSAAPPGYRSDRRPVTAPDRLRKKTKK